MIFFHLLEDASKFYFYEASLQILSQRHKKLKPSGIFKQYL